MSEPNMEKFSADREEAAAYAKDLLAAMTEARLRPRVAALALAHVVAGVIASTSQSRVQASGLFTLFTQMTGATIDAEMEARENGTSKED